MLKRLIGYHPFILSLGVEICPEDFGYDEDAEKVIVIQSEGGEEDCIEEGMGTCPVE